MDGEIIARLILKHMATDTAVSLSFKGVGLVSSSFIGSVLIPLLDKYSSELIMAKLDIKDSTRYINDLIRRIFNY